MKNPAPSPVTAPPPFHPQEYSLLLVDDDDDQRSYFETFLLDQGFRVYAASSPEQAFKVLNKTYIDVIISDFHMPSMSGLQFAEHFRRLQSGEEGPRLPIIMLTNCDQRLEQAALILGVDRFCEKRFAEQYLVEHVRALVE